MITIQQLQKALGELPQPEMGSANQRQIIADKMATDPYVQKQKEEYMRRIDQIASMDTKLAGVYGDSGSKLFIENPMAREQAIGGARQIMTGNAQAGLQDVQSAQAKAEEEARNMIQLYEQGIAEQKRQKEISLEQPIDSYNSSATLRDKELDKYLGKTAKQGLEQFIEDDMSSFLE